MFTISPSRVGELPRRSLEDENTSEDGSVTSSSEDSCWDESYDASCMDGFDLFKATTLGYGGSAMVVAVNEALACKVFGPSPRGYRELQVEREIFMRLNIPPRSPNIVQFVGCWGHGIVMERHSMSLRKRLRLSGVTPDLQRRWISASAHALAFLHSRGILHRDFGCHNILIDSGDQIKLCDFAGSKLDDKEFSGTYEERSRHPGNRPETATISGELFALGSAIFEIETLRSPYEELSVGEVRQKFKAGDFPLGSIPNLFIRRIVEGCWKETYSEVSQVCKLLGDE